MFGQKVSGRDRSPAVGLGCLLITVETCQRVSPGASRVSFRRFLFDSFNSQIVGDGKSRRARVFTESVGLDALNLPGPDLHNRDGIKRYHGKVMSGLEKLTLIS